MNPRARLAGRVAIVTVGAICWLLLAAVAASLIAMWTTTWTGSMSGGAAFSSITFELFFILAAFALSRKLESPPAFGPPGKAVLWGVAGALVILPLNAGLSWLCEKAGFPPELPPEYLPHARNELIVWGIAMPLVAIGEEWLFRHAFPALFKLAGAGPALTVAMSALLFGLIHLSQGWIAIPLTALLALPFFYLKRKSGGLGAPILAHLLSNVAALAWMLTRPPG